ncbi:hypothetical protein [Candidatus Nanohalobium constans]|uniref:Uncharacterized protein n=1 Tax=Candidatus Nanohalobium constans TaxID=2565781 RepID=A0A5Q0UGB9_9ARCH|nr:hypothetical protein [Candidatus Nanohalobium constans]QGA80250.1 hypothetical protein LC1Nh_0349 [Candidatus Nanohalobium constans]
MAGNQYVLRLEGDRILVESGGETYSTPLTGFKDYDLSGSIRGGEATIFKRGNNIKLRSS